MQATLVLFKSLIPPARCCYVPGAELHDLDCNTVIFVVTWCTQQVQDLMANLEWELIELEMPRSKLRSQPQLSRTSVAFSDL
jgi:hypothetical protein